jgi:hypothetical protein
MINKNKKYVFSFDGHTHNDAIKLVNEFYNEKLINENELKKCKTYIHFKNDLFLCNFLWHVYETYHVKENIKINDKEMRKHFLYEIVKHGYAETY